MKIYPSHSFHGLHQIGLLVGHLLLVNTVYALDKKPEQPTASELEKIKQKIQLYQTIFQTH